MEFYNLGIGIKVFTTDRTEGRDGDKIRCALMPGTSKFLKIPADFLPVVYPHQTHTDKVYKIDREFFEKDMAVEENLLITSSGSLKEGGTSYLVDGALRDTRLEGIDAVISDVPNVVFGISTADCIPVVVYDPEHHAAAAIHAGWKGTVLKIVEKAVVMMKTEYGTDPINCTAVIGPGISQESFEVGYEVVERFKDAGFEMTQFVKFEEPSAKFKSSPLADKMGAPHIDLKAINKAQLLKLGLLPQNITVSQIDTFTDERLFSARREQKDSAHKCGRILTGFILR